MEVDLFKVCESCLSRHQGMITLKPFLVDSSFIQALMTLQPESALPITPNEVSSPSQIPRPKTQDLRCGEPVWPGGLVKTERVFRRQIRGLAGVEFETVHVRVSREFPQPSSPPRNRFVVREVD